MKKFTFISMLMLIVSTMAKAELMDKYFFKIPTDKMAAGWIIQDAGNFASTPGKEYLEVQNKKNGGRMLNYFWNEDAWAKTDVNNLPNNTYKFTMDLKMSNMDARADMEFVLLPVGACKSDDARVQTHNQRWWNSAEGEDYFFRWRVGEKPAAANGDFTIWINENPTGKTDWTQTTEETLVISSQKLYKFAVEINVADKTATYTIADADGNVLKTGVHNYVCAENRAGIMVFSMNGTSTHQLSNMGLSYKAEGPFAGEPNVEMLAVIGEQRAYYVTFAENETLHWVQLGNAEDVIGNAFTDGEEYTAEYGDANDTREFETNPDEYFGSKIIYCSKSGELKVWTSLADNPENTSDEIVENVVCEPVKMPVPTAQITNVGEGYSKEYKISADNSETLLTPTVTIHCTINAGGKVTESDFLSGEIIKLDDACTIELYAYDGTHPTPWYTQSEVVTINNNVKYKVAEDKNYVMTADEIKAGLAGFNIVEIVDAAGKSHWDRIMSSEKRGYKEDGSNEVYNADNAASYTWVKEGHNLFADTSCGTADAKWNVLCPQNVREVALPLIPSEEDPETYKVLNEGAEYAWSYFPFEGLVYYDVNTKAANGVCAVKSNPAGEAGYVEMQLDQKYVSDDASKPNFYIVYKTGGYNRPDKGDCTSSEVVVTSEKFWLFRYDTAISRVKVMTYDGFVPGSGTGISSVNANETAPAVKKVMTNKGLVIVKGDKAYSVSGAQIK